MATISPRRIYALLLAGYAAWVIYGSLLPLAFHFPANIPGFPARLAWLLRSLFDLPWRVSAWSNRSSLGVPVGVSDFILNAALYLPLGILWRLRRRHGGFSWAGQILPAILGCALLSWAMEWLQHLTPGRVPSLGDVCFNTVGAAVGALAAGPLERGVKRRVFALYCRGSGLRRRLFPWMRGPGNGAVAAGLVLFSLAWLALPTFATALAANGHNPIPGVPGVPGGMPFVRMFKRSFDVAATQLFPALAFDFALAGLIWIAARWAGRKLTPLGLAGAMLLLCLARQLLALGVCGAGPDLTDDALALLAAGLVATITTLTSAAIARSCRRKVNLPVAFDRRRG